MSLRLGEIWVYPVKSLGGARVPRCEVQDRGLAGDRRFMVVDGSGRFVTQRDLPIMASVSARLEGDVLRLVDREGASIEVSRQVEGAFVDVAVWNDQVSAVDAGDPVAGWLSSRLSQDVRLVRMPETTRRPADPRHAAPEDLVSFADGFSFLLVTDGSLAALNERLASPVDVRRFRPNLVVTGAAPFAEDAWSRLTIGGIGFRVSAPCGRCSVVNVDPDRAERTTEPLSTLAGFRTRDRQVDFGQNLQHDGLGTLAEGDPVAAE